MNSKIKIATITLFCIVFILSFSEIYAEEWWSKATDFFNQTDWRSHKNYNMLSDLKQLIKMLGNMVFVVVTAVMGIKYMASSAEGKGDVKEGLTSLVVAIVLFYGWTALDNILTKTDGSMNYWFNTDSTEKTITNIFSTAVDMLNYISVGVLIYVGVKYLFSGAEGKADLKGKGIPFVVGLVMTFATISFLNFLIKVVGDVLS